MNMSTQEQAKEMAGVDGVHPMTLISQMEMPVV